MPLELDAVYLWEDRINDICMAYLKKPLTNTDPDETISNLHSALCEEVKRIYQEGGHICDSDGVPVMNYEDVDILVSRDEEVEGKLNALIAPSEHWRREHINGRMY